MWVDWGVIATILLQRARSLAGWVAIVLCLTILQLVVSSRMCELSASVTPCHRL